MSAIMLINHIAVAALVLLALISDIKTYKIKNSLTLPFIWTGFVLNFIALGFHGILFSLAGTSIPLLILMPLYVLRMIGAGDIKLFSSLGAIMGLKFVLYTVMYSFLAGGVIAIILIVVRKNAKARIGYLLQYLKSCLLTLSLLPYTDFEDKSDGSKFRFSYAVACGTLLSVLFK